MRFQTCFTNKRTPQLFVALILLMSGFASFTTAQPAAPCGIVDAIDYPIDITDTLSDNYDDFALYRARFEGNHVGIDIGFNRLGDPVHAAARGRVTLSNIEEWDTEKGVVIVEHTFPDGSTAYSLYGHMQENETIFFPPVESCVERGDVLGLIGWPSRGLPHLHYELRRHLAREGGPGYVEVNPLLEGWYHPLDFTEQWRTRLQPGVMEVTAFHEVPTLPPALMSDGTSVLALGDTLVGYDGGLERWRIMAGGVVTGMVSLPGDRVVARARGGQVLSLQSGRFAGVWNAPGPDSPLVAFGETGEETIAMATEGNTLAAYALDGTRLWETSPFFSEEARVLDLQTDGNAISVAWRSEGVTQWRLLSEDGRVQFERAFDAPVALFAPVPATSSWLFLDDTTLFRVTDGTATELAMLPALPARTARMTADVLGNIYLVLGDATSTMLSISARGEVRWRAVYPYAANNIPPLLDVGGGCLLYSLDVDGMLNVFDGSTGELAAQRRLYPGGVRNGSPRARLLRATVADQVVMGGGFLSAITLNGSALAPEVMAECRLG